MTTKELGQRIAERRKQKGLTQEELAAKANINVRTIQRIEAGEVDPRTYTIQEIARVLDIDPLELLDQDDTDNRLWILLLHMTNYIPVIIPALLIYVYKKNQVPEIREHGIMVLNFQISMFFLLMLAGISSIILIGIILAPMIGLMIWITTTINILRFLGGHQVKYPLSMRLLK